MSDYISREEVMENFNTVETPVGIRKVVDMEVVKNMSSAFEEMTNGEVIQALFPKIELGEKVYNRRRYFLMGEPIDMFDFNTTDRWWNAPYQKGGEI